MNVTFKFNSQWSNVEVTLVHSVGVFDKLESEWCAFDDVDVSFTSDKTYEWYIANEILSLYNGVSRAALPIERFNGVQYYGDLTNGNFKLGLVHETNSDGEVTSECVLVKVDRDGKTSM